MKGLIIDEQWIGLILQGNKTWEMRTSTWKHRGHIGLIRKKSGHVVGVAELVDNRPPLTNLAAYAEAENFHCIPPENAQPLRRPVPYRHPNGAVKSVNLSEEVAAQVRRQLAA